MFIGEDRVAGNAIQERLQHTLPLRNHRYLLLCLSLLNRIFAEGHSPQSEHPRLNATNCPLRSSNHSCTPEVAGASQVTEMYSASTVT